MTMGKTILISIHPEYVSKIISGEKIFEYRKILPKQKISHLVFYCTAPVKRILAIADVLGCIVGSPTKVWNTTSIGSGISRLFFREYFYGRRVASAFIIGNVYEMKEPIALSSLAGIRVPPQSYCYLDDLNLNKILKLQARVPSQNSRMVFMGGVHGVGKSIICKKIFTPAGYHCVSASSLIADQGKKTDDNKRVINVSANQSVLIKALKNKIKNYNRLLLDGHFTLINDQGNIEPIDIDVFRSMKINQLFFVKGRADEISVRLKNRDDKKWNASFIDMFQKEEENHARYIAKNLSIPFRILRN